MDVMPTWIPLHGVEDSRSISKGPDTQHTEPDVLGRVQYFQDILPLGRVGCKHHLHTARVQQQCNGRNLRVDTDIRAQGAHQELGVGACKVERLAAVSCTISGLDNKTSATALDELCDQPAGVACTRRRSDTAALGVNQGEDSYLAISERVPEAAGVVVAGTTAVAAGAAAAAQRPAQCGANFSIRRVSWPAGSRRQAIGVQQEGRGEAGSET